MSEDTVPSTCVLQDCVVLHKTDEDSFEKRKCVICQRLKGKCSFKGGLEEKGIEMLRKYVRMLF